MPQTQEFDFLAGVKPLSQQGKIPLVVPPRPEAVSPPQFSFLDDLTPLGATPEEKPNILERVKGLVGGIKEKFSKKETEEEKRFRGTPEQPVMAAMTPKETASFERGTVPIAPRRFPKAEDLEYGKLEQLLDIPGQFLTNWVNMRAFGIPGLIHEKLTGEKLPGAKTPAAEVGGAGGALYGLANFPVKGVALGKGYAPFEVTRGLAQRVLGKPMKNVVGRLVQKAAENVATLGLGMGAVEWQGRDPLEVIQNKLRATGSGAITGLVFSGAESVNFAKLYPMINHILRFGVASGVLDMAHGTSPFDERTLFEKSFDYGLNWIFTKEGVSPKEYKAYWKQLNKELLRFNSEAKEDGIEFLMPTGEALNDRLTELAGDPSKWAEAPTAKVEPKGLPQPVGYEVTPGGTAYRPGEMPEAARTLLEYREAEIKPEEKTRSVINIKPRDDGSFDVENVTRAAEAAAPKPTIEQAGRFPPGFNEKGEVKVKDYYRFFFAQRGFADDGWVFDYNSETGIARAVEKGAPQEGLISENGKPVYRSTAYGKVPEPTPEKVEPGEIMPEKAAEEMSLDELAGFMKPAGEEGAPEEAALKKTEGGPKLSEKPLINWVRKQGGIQPASLAEAGMGKGELRDIYESKQKYILKGTGKSIVKLAEMAQQEGFIKTSEVDELREAIISEIQGRPQPRASEAEDYFTEKAKEEAEYYYEQKGGEMEETAKKEGVKEEPEVEYEAAARKPTVAIKDKRTGKVYLGNPGETAHALMVERLQRKGVKPDDMIPGWLTPERKWAENLSEARGVKAKEEPKAERELPAPKKGEILPSQEITPDKIAAQKLLRRQAAEEFVEEAPDLEMDYGPEAKAREEVEKQVEAKEISEAVEEKRAETPAVKELDDRLDAIAEEVEKALTEGKLNRELTAEEKFALQAKGKYKEEKPGPEKAEPLPEGEPGPEPEAKKPPKKQRLVRVSVKIPTGTTEEIGELPVDRVDSLKEYAKKLGVEADLVIGKEFEGEWQESISPKDIEATVKEVLRDVKRKPKEWWEQWEDKAEKTREVWAGLPPPEFAKRAAKWFMDAMQIEPQFKRINAPETGLAMKRYHPIRNAEMERGLDSIASLGKKYKDLKLSKDEWQELTFIAASEKRFNDLTPEQKSRYGEITKDVRKFFDDYAKREKELGIFVEEWPKSALRRLVSERDHYKEALKRLKNDTPRRQKVEKALKEINETITWINEARPQYVHIPKTWLEKFWEKNAEKAPRIITEFFHERKTFDIEQLAGYLLKHHVISKNDLDIRGIMAQYGHKAGHKIALAEIFRNAEKEGLILDMDKAPKSWQSLPGQKFPTLRGKRVHPVFVDFFEKNFIKRGFSPPMMGKILGTVKMLQFYNPAFLPMYDVFQAWWTGSVRSPKTPLYIKRAYGSMRQKDDAYWDAHYWGAFSTPFTPNFESYAKQVDRAVKGHSFIRRAGDFISVYPIAWKAAWWGDNLIRLISYHHYIEKGESPRDAAQLTAKAHADYASIPPSTRKFLNKWFFTPSFKISMMAAQSEMIKDSAKYLFGGREGRAKMTKLDKGMAKMITGLVTGMALREATFHALGFKTDQYGLKYVKKVTDENGEEKELVLHAANPDNVFLRFYHRFKSLPMEPNKFTGFVDRAKWELHPLWQLGMEVMSNKGFSMEPVYDVFDKPEIIVKDITAYSAKRVLRVLELLPGQEEKGRGKTAYTALIKDLGHLGEVLSLFALPYLRNVPELRLQYKLQNLIQQYKNLERNKPALSDEQAEERLNNLDKHLQRIYDELEKQ